MAIKKMCMFLACLIGLWQQPVVSMELIEVRESMIDGVPVYMLASGESISIKSGFAHIKTEEQDGKSVKFSIPLNVLSEKLKKRFSEKKESDNAVLLFTKKKGQSAGVERLERCSCILSKENIDFLCDRMNLHIGASVGLPLFSSSSSEEESLVDGLVSQLFGENDENNGQESKHSTLTQGAVDQLNINNEKIELGQQGVDEVIGRTDEVLQNSKVKFAGASAVILATIFALVKYFDITLEDMQNISWQGIIKELSRFTFLR